MFNGIPWVFIVGAVAVLAWIAWQLYKPIGRTGLGDGGLEYKDPQPLSDEAKVARAIRAKHAMDEFFAPAFKDIEAEYLLALTQLAASEPWETSKITKLAVAQRVIKAVEQHVIKAVLEGEVASQELERAKKIAALPEARRRWAM